MSFESYALDLQSKNIQIFGYPLNQTKTYTFDEANPLQSEGLSATIPGLTIVSLGTIGQRSSLRFNNSSAGELTLLFDGFEFSDLSDPSEGFDLSQFLLLPGFNLSLNTSSTSGFFSRQTGGVISIEPLYSDVSYIKTAVGANQQGLFLIQNNTCKSKSCLSLGLGGVYANPQSAAINSNVNSKLEKDSSKQAYLSLAWQKKWNKDRILKFRSYSQYANLDIDDYDLSFKFVDDPNAQINFQNYFLGTSYQIKNHQIYFENMFSERNMENTIDAFNDVNRNEVYKVVKSKLRGVHTLGNYDLYWFLQSLNLETKTLVSENKFNKFESGLQINKDLTYKYFRILNSLSFNTLESFGFNYSLAQNIQSNINKKTILKSYYGYKKRRPSVFQLFDPQFGNENLNSEQLFFIRPQLEYNLLASRRMKHNISASYFFENGVGKVVYQKINSGFKYLNSENYLSHSLVLNYELEALSQRFNLFFRQAFDSKETLQSLPWSARQELGFGSALKLNRIGFSTNIKWLFGMYNPSRQEISNIVQSQASLSYQFEAKDLINLQLNNIFNDKKIWDEGFNRQSFSWMLSLTKTI